MALMVNRDAPYSGLSSLMAMQGRYGDTELVHMSKPEIQGLASLGQLTINPDTGLPEAFSLKRILPIAAGIAGSILLPAAAPALAGSLGATGAAALGTGLGTFGGGLLAGQKPGEALLGGVTSGLMSFGIGSLLGGGVPGLSEGTTATLPQDVISSGMIDPLGEGILSSAASSPINIATGTPTLAASLAEPSATISASGLGEPSIYEIASTSKMLANQPVSSLSEEVLSSGMLDPLGEGIMASPKLTPTYSLSKAYEPGTFGKLIGREAVPAGDITREQFIQLGGTPSDTTFKEVALQKAKDPLTYAPLGIAALTGGLEEPYEAPELAARKPVETGFNKFELEGGDVRRPVATEEEYLRRAVEGGSQRYFDPYRYVRTAAEGGIVGLQQGGMATPQAPSAMSAMLTPPVQQPQPIQPINIAVQPPQQQPQQPQPMAPMGQGPAPLPDQQKEFMKLMDMEEQVQSQKQAAALQGTSALAGLLSSAEGMMQQYPQTSPSGQAVQPPSPPPMTYGSQVNLGASGGFAQGGIINRADGGPTRQQFNDFMKNISNTPVGLLMRLAGADKQFASQLPAGEGGGGAESMNQLLSRNVYSNNAGSSAAAPVQSEGGAASMNQLLARPAYSRQAAEGGIVEYNQGGMPSQTQPYFEGQVEGPGDGQSDEVAFRVDGGQVDGAMLSPDEYVLAADVVSAIGNGSSDAGAAKLDQFMKGVRQDAYGTTKQMQPFNNQGLTNLVA